jgi:hypothetical protein
MPRSSPKCATNVKSLLASIALVCFYVSGFAVHKPFSISSQIPDQFQEEKPAEYAAASSFAHVEGIRQETSKTLHRMLRVGCRRWSIRPAGWPISDSGIAAPLEALGTLHSQGDVHASWLAGLRPPSPSDVFQPNLASIPPPEKSV